MKKPSFILVNEETKTFTNLNEFDEKKKRFKGEYSLLHNQYSDDHVFLSLFLKENQEKPLMVFNSQNQQYRNVLAHYNRFLENDIPKYIEEKIQQKHSFEKDVQMDRNLGQLQLSIVQQMVEKQLESVRNQTAETASDHQVLLGKELSLQWVLHMMNDVIHKGNL